MKKKLLSVILCLGMFGSLLSGCSGNTSGQSTAAPENTQGGQDSAEASGSETEAATEGGYTEVEKVILYTPFIGNNEDKDNVVEAINAITRTEIGVELQWEQFDIGQWFQQYSLFLSGTDDIDILFNFGGISTAVAQGAALDITDIVEEYGQGIKEVLGQYIVNGEVGGRLYGLAPFTTYGSAYGINYRKDIVRELGLEDVVAQVKTLDDWTPVLAAVKEAYPEMTPFVTATGSTMYNFFYGDWDNLGNGIGVLLDGGADTKVTNLFETDLYRELCTTMNEWYKAGYSSMDIQTQTDSYSLLCSQGIAFSTITNQDFNSEFRVSSETAQEIGSIQLGEPFAKTYTDALYTVMANSKHPEAAVRFLNMMYTDKRILDMMSYGIEDVHYQVTEDGRLDYMDGQDASTCTYHDQMAACANQVLRTLWATENPEYPTGIVEVNNTCKQSKALGFVFDSTPVQNQVTEIENILGKYRNGLECGALDVEENLDKFNDELKSAGIEDVIAEKQRQLDEWLANK